jgi:hypothetical protein
MMIEMMGMRLATFVDIAKELGTTSNQIYMWYQRRERNGFPEPVLHRSAGNGINDAPWFDIDEVLEWRAAYTPRKGGWHTHRARRNY